MDGAAAHRLLLGARMLRFLASGSCAMLLACSLTEIPTAGHGEEQPAHKDDGITIITQAPPAPDEAAAARPARPATTSPGPSSAPPPPPPIACSPLSIVPAPLPTMVVPAPIQPGACTQNQAWAIAHLVYGIGPSPMADASWQDFLTADANQVCVACALVPPTTERGPLFNEGQGWDFNVAGCAAHFTGLACGARVAALLACEDGACARCGDRDYPACIDAAHQSVCSSAGTSCMTPGVRYQCLPSPQESAELYAARLITFWCGGP